MNEKQKSARNWLSQSTRRSFYDVLREAKVTPRQLEICKLRFIRGLYNYQIGMQLNISEKTVEREISAAYKAINRVLAT